MTNLQLINFNLLMYMYRDINKHIHMPAYKHTYIYTRIFENHKFLVLHVIKHVIHIFINHIFKAFDIFHILGKDSCKGHVRLDSFVSLTSLSLIFLALL